MPKILTHGAAAAKMQQTMEARTALAVAVRPVAWAMAAWVGKAVALPGPAAALASAAAAALAAASDASWEARAWAEALAARQAPRLKPTLEAKTQ